MGSGFFRRSAVYSPTTFGTSPSRFSFQFQFEARAFLGVVYLANGKLAWQSAGQTLDVDNLQDQTRWVLDLLRRVSK
jgi:hypothetical protein